MPLRGMGRTGRRAVAPRKKLDLNTRNIRRTYHERCRTATKFAPLALISSTGQKRAKNAPKMEIRTQTNQTGAHTAFAPPQGNASRGPSVPKQEKELIAAGQIFICELTGITLSAKLIENPYLSIRKFNLRETAKCVRIQTISLMRRALRPRCEETIE